MSILDRIFPLPKPTPARQYSEGYNTFTFNGVTYPLGRNSTLYGNKEEIDGSFASLAQSAYYGNSIVFACMLVRQSLFSQVRFMFQELRKGIPGDLYSTPALGGLNEDPSPGETTGDLLSKAIVNADLAGNAFIVNRNGEYVNLRPDWVTIVLGSPSGSQAGANASDAQKIGYIYHPGGRYSEFPVETFLPEEVCHFAPIKDPLAHYRGMSWLTPIIREIQGDIASSEFKTIYYTQGATPNMIISLDASIKGEAFETWVDKFEQAHVGPQNAGKTVYLGAGATAQVVGANFQQNDYKNVQGAGETRIVAAAGLHPSIVTISEGLQGSSLNEGNFTAAARLVADKTFRYLWSQFAGSMQTLIPPPGGSRLWYDASQVDFLKDAETDRVAVVQTNATTIEGLIREGYDPDAVVDAVMAGDLRRLKGKHSGMISVQLHDPTSPPEPPQLPPGPPAPAQIPANVPTNAGRSADAAEVRCSGCSKLLAEFAAAPYRMTCSRCKAVTSVGLGPETVERFEFNGQYSGDEMLAAIAAVAARSEPAPPVPKTVRTEIVDPRLGTFVITEVSE